MTLGHSLELGSVFQVIVCRPSAQQKTHTSVRASNLETLIHFFLFEGTFQSATYKPLVHQKRVKYLIICY